MTDPDPTPDDLTPEAAAVLHDEAWTRLDADADDPAALRDLSIACLRLGGLATAVPILERLAGGSTPDPVLLSDLMSIEFRLGRFDPCLATCERIIARGEPRSTRAARATRVRARLRLGRLEEAAEELTTLVRTGGGANVVTLLAQLDEARGERARARDRLRPLVSNERLPTDLRLSAAFDLARLHDRLGEPDDAFEMASLAGRIGAVEFDLDAFERETEEILAAWTPERIATMPRSENDDERPVFIVGMPRSGTTLLDRIIDAHPDAMGVQEQFEIDMISRLLVHRTGRPAAGVPETAPPSMLEELATGYLAMLEDFATRLDGNDHARPRRLVNKALGLDRHAGLISRLFPSARLVLVSRQPLDNLLSIYLNPISPAQIPWSTSLEGLVAARRRFDRLREHWLRTLDIGMHDVAYEDLVRDPEAQIRDLVDALGLPFDPACLRFHDSDRGVATPSWDQVNKPINDRAVERWRRYERHIGPLLDAFPPSSDG